MDQVLQRKHSSIILLLLITLFGLIVISVNVGYKDIPLVSVVKALLGMEVGDFGKIIIDFRLPRIIIAILVGAGLAVSGAVIQGIVKNPLAAPGLLGINSGAGLVVIGFIVIGGTLKMSSILALPFLSLLGAAVVGILIYLLAYEDTMGINPMKMVFYGIAIQAGVNAIMTILVITLNESQMDFLVRWQSGSIWNANWEFISALMPWIIIGGLYMMKKASTMDILALGNTLATGLGLNVSKEKGKLLFTAIALAASSVAVSGTMNFVGLIAPHIARKLVGERYRILLPTSALLGAVLVLLADTIGRKLIEPAEIPAGIVVSVIGAPYFIYLLIRLRKEE